MSKAVTDENEAAAMACWRCGYDLRFQEPDGRCPECGMPLAETAERLDALEHYGNPKPLWRACWAVLGSVVILLGVVAILIGGIFSLANTVGAAGAPPAVVITTFYVIGTVLPAVLLWLTAWCLSRNPPPTGQINRRVLGLLGWLIPSGVVVLWLAGLAFYLDIDLPAEAEAGLQALLVLIGAAAMLYPPVFVAEVVRRARFWPHWQWLPTAGQIVRFVLLIGAALVLLPSLFFLVGDAVGWSMYEREPTYGATGGWVPPVEKPLTVGLRYAVYVGSVGYSLAMLPWIGLLITTLVGLRRVSRLVDSTPPNQRGFEVAVEPEPSTAARTD